MSATWADTPWGKICALIAAEVALDFPVLSAANAIGIGPDAASLHKAPPALTFEWDADAPIQPGLRSTIFDDMIPIRATVWMADPVQADIAATSIVLAINTKAHGRSGVPARKTKPQGGDIGAAGAKMGVLFTLRLANARAPYPQTVPTGETLTAGASEGLPPDEAILVP